LLSVACSLRFTKLAAAFNSHARLLFLRLYLTHRNKEPKMSKNANCLENQLLQKIKKYEKTLSTSLTPEVRAAFEKRLARCREDLQYIPKGKS
jgi:hypothetical protein